MKLDQIIADFPAVSSDAIAVGYRGPGDPTGTMIYVNDAYTRIFGFQREAILGGPVEITNDPDYWDDFLAEVVPKFAAGERNFTIETGCIRADGSKLWASLSFFVVPDPETGGRYTTAVYRDISDLRRRELSAEDALQERERLYSRLEGSQSRLIAAINTIPDPFAIFNKNGMIRTWNAAYSKLMCDDADAIYDGMAHEEIMQVAIELGRIPEDSAAAYKWFFDAPPDEPGPREPMKQEAIAGRRYQVYRSSAPNGDVVILRVDVTELSSREEEVKRYAERLERVNADIEYKATHDELTGLGNRRYLELALDAAREARAQKGCEIAVLNIDLDRFKQINDTMGHKAGDHVLEVVAERLRSIFRKDDAIARIGGDEFLAVVLSNTGSVLPEAIAQRVVTSLGRPVMFEGRPCRFGASVGIASTPLADEAELLVNSDVALFEAKNRGRARIATFSAAMLHRMQENKRLADDILRALDANEFVPVYQPQVAAKDRALVGFETLARWQHPERGLLGPHVFLGVADDLGVVGEIDRIIFEKALSECNEAFGGLERPPKLSFNVSSPRIMDDTILQVSDWLKTYPGEVAFELLESIFFEEEAEEFWYRLDALRELGIGFEMDDFGSGRASLIALMQIGPTRLKIDGRLIAPIPQSKESRDLVQAIVEIGRSLNTGITAEGVETEEQADLLTRMGCDTLQGYFFGKPQPLSGNAHLLPRGTRLGARRSGT
ncbi:MAG: EAL domain-containing protein [Alphaproteobacteria bacterium]|nr:EAL domain-containing protein [Alphaproteobacteria bacterium]NNF24780.1 EAL domain-containing protein [Paracoccaceae bacterium]